MESSRDDFVDSVQKASVEKIRETYGQQVFSKWQTPRFLGRMSDVSCIGKITGKCGDTIEIYLRKKKTTTFKMQVSSQTAAHVLLLMVQWLLSWPLVRT